MGDPVGRPRATLGIIAGGGGLPLAIARACARDERPCFVVRLKGLADPALAGFAGSDVGVVELGACLRSLRQARCETVTFAGNVRRPADFADLKPDLVALRYLPGVAAAARGGDDALLRAILAVFEREGFQVEGVGEAGSGLTLPPGSLGKVEPRDDDRPDIDRAVTAALEVGASDIGQAAVVRDGKVVAREAADGTDAMLARLAPAQARGVLAKLPKPRQDRRVDLPTIGVATLEAAAALGLAGVVGEAGALLMVEPDRVREAADRLGLFVLGLERPAT